MRLFFIYLLGLVAAPLMGQTETFRVVQANNAYTWRTCSLAEVDSYYFNLVPVTGSNYRTHIRLSCYTQTIDLYSADNKNFQGILTNRICRYKSVEHEGEQRTELAAYLSQQVPLDSAFCTQAAQKLLETGLDTLPDSLLNISGIYIHCGNIVFDCQRDTKYNHLTFRCPWGQTDSLFFRKTILDNYEYIEKSVALDSLYKNFENLLPKGHTYSRDGYMMMYIPTEKESRQSRKYVPQSQYMKSVRDTLGQYLSHFLSNGFPWEAEVNHEDFWLVFSPKGKCIKIKPMSEKSDRWDEKIYRADKRKLRQLLAKSDLTFIRPPRRYVVALHYAAGKEWMAR